jgi:hypothetical protein
VRRGSSAGEEGGPPYARNSREGGGEGLGNGGAAPTAARLQELGGGEGARIAARV